jgi:cytochrome c-type biogenesis protein
MTISYGLAFLAGLASFFSPCVFSLVPVYIGYLAGRSAGDGGNTIHNERLTFLHGVAFILGFSLVFILLGLTVSALGSILYNIKDYLAKIGGVVIMLFGIHMTGIYRFSFLEYDLRPHSELDKNRGFISSFMLGILFSAGWSPCIGPVLGTILTLAMNQGNIKTGTAMLVVYSLGMAIPFLIAAVGVGWVGKVLKRYSKWMHYTEVGMGVLLIVVGILLIAGVFSQLARLGSPFITGL